MTTYVLVAICIISLGVLLYLRQSEKASPKQAATLETTVQKEQKAMHRAKIEQSAPPGKASDQAVKNPSPTPRATTPRVGSPQGKKTAPLVSQSRPIQAAKDSRDTGQPTRSRAPLPKRSKKAATKIKTPISRPVETKTAPIQRATRPTTQAQSSQAPQYSRLQNTDITLQAIAWAPEPAKRIAVINGSIVREGETIEGFTLMRIRKDDIVLNDGRKTWQLNFGLKP